MEHEARSVSRWKIKRLLLRVLCSTVLKKEETGLTGFTGWKKKPSLGVNPVNPVYPVCEFLFINLGCRPAA
jgi:hypothetical protein